MRPSRGDARSLADRRDHVQRLARGLLPDAARRDPRRASARAAARPATARRVGLALLGNALSHPAVWFVFPALGLGWVATTALSETWAWLVEGALYRAGLAHARLAPGARRVARGQPALVRPGPRSVGARSPRMRTGRGAALGARPRSRRWSTAPARSSCSATWTCPGRRCVAVIAWIVSYDALAFLLQAPIGLVADRLRADRELGLAGLALVLVALAAGPLVPGAGAVVAALGNALFHVGAGAAVLRASGVRAAEIGYFVGPGATGLCLGIVLGRGDAPVRAALALALLVGRLRGRALRAERCARRSARRSAGVGIAGAIRVLLGCVLLLLTVATRSIVGDTVTSVWRTQPVAAVLGSGARVERGQDAGRRRRRPDRLECAARARRSCSRDRCSRWGSRDLRCAAAGLLLLQATTPLTLKALHGVASGAARLRLRPAERRARARGGARPLQPLGPARGAARARGRLAFGRGRRRRPRARRPALDRARGQPRPKPRPSAAARSPCRSPAAAARSR